MARTQGTFLENQFIKGLITENTALNFPTDACTETWNCVFDETGKVTRRRGIDIELSDSSFTSTHANGDAFTEFNWTQVGVSTETEFVVQQIGYMLHFFDVSTSTNIGTNKTSFTLDLRAYVSGDFETQLRQNRCTFAQGRGRMFVAHQYCPPLAVRYSATAGTIIVEKIRLERRDTTGLADGLEIDERPSYADIETMWDENPAHFYNLLNQGYYVPTVLGQWDVDRADMPSNVDQVAFYRNSETDAYAANRVTANNPGKSPAPRGHFITEVGVDDRQGAFMSEPWILRMGSNTNSANAGSPANFTIESDNWTKVSPSDGTVIGDMTNEANAFNSTLYRDADAGIVNATGTDCYIGKNFSTARRIAIASITTGSDDFIALAGDAETITLELYGSNSSPANSTDGTFLGSNTVIPHDLDLRSGTASQLYHAGTYTVVSNDWTNSYEYVWVRLSYSSSTTFQLSEVTFFETTLDRQYPSQVAFFNGRLFWAGFSNPALSDTIFFTQVIERPAQYGQCYTANDPTSEFLPDTLDNDGGSIELVNLGKVVGIFPFQNQLLIIAKNGVFVITGTGGGAFAATSFSVRRLTSTGTIAGQSLVNVRGLPLWWAEDGIYTVEFDANYQSATIKSVTENSIKEFITDIPEANREYVKGAYDRVNDVAYWIFSDADPLVAWKYNKCLCYNVKSGAFYPWEFTESTDNPQDIHGIFYVESGDRSADPAIKFTISYGTQTFNYAQEYQTTYKDWGSYATDVTADADDEMDYSSYFVAGYRIPGEGMTNFQSNYLHMFMERLANSSAWVRGQFYWTDNGDSGKWSTAQQAYRNDTDKGRTHQAIKRSRLMVRGSGPALQFRVFSETGKPFCIIGWGVFATGNQQV